MIAQWKSALGNAAEPCDPDALTLVEIAQQCGVHHMTAYRRLCALLRAGKATVTVKEIRTSSGHRRRVPAYKLVKEPKAKR